MEERKCRNLFKMVKKNAFHTLTQLTNSSIHVLACTYQCTTIILISIPLATVCCLVHLLQNGCMKVQEGRSSTTRSRLSDGWVKKGAGLGAAWCRNNKGSPRKKLQRDKGREGEKEEWGKRGREGGMEGGKPREAPAAESAHRNEDPSSPLPLQPLPCPLLQPHSPSPHYN